MAGVYLHIPFCKQACYYCDFHFSTSLKHKDEMLLALSRELEIKRSELKGETISTIYFGGGTPSLLSASEISQLLDRIYQLLEVDNTAEITIEANPDDLDNKKVAELAKTSINRFSIGVQSFRQQDLDWMNRAHSAEEAITSIKRIQDAGFENITIDLIYGLPDLSDEHWLENIHQALQLNVPHISAYGLTVEEGTALKHKIDKREYHPVSDAHQASQFLLLMDTLEKNNFEHYEISNFCKTGFESRHNSNYWKGKKYLGIGPSAHSFDGQKRSWNISNNIAYINAIKENKPFFEQEVLTTDQQYNEYILTGLRTKWGIELDKVEKEFGVQYLKQMMSTIDTFSSRGWISYDQRTVKLTKSGRLFADKIASDFFVV